MKRRRIPELVFIGILHALISGGTVRAESEAPINLALQFDRAELVVRGTWTGGIEDGRIRILEVLKGTMPDGNQELPVSIEWRGRTSRRLPWLPGTEVILLAGAVKDEALSAIEPRFRAVWPNSDSRCPEALSRLSLEGVWAVLERLDALKKEKVEEEQAKVLEELATSDAAGMLTAMNAMEVRGYWPNRRPSEGFRRLLSAVFRATGASRDGSDLEQLRMIYTMPGTVSAWLRQVEEWLESEDAAVRESAYRYLKGMVKPGTELPAFTADSPAAKRGEQMKQLKPAIVSAFHDAVNAESPRLLEDLEAESWLVREGTARALRYITGETLGYDSRDPAPEKVKAWRDRLTVLARRAEKDGTGGFFGVGRSEGKESQKADAAGSAGGVRRDGETSR